MMPSEHSFRRCGFIAVGAVVAAIVATIVILPLLEVPWLRLDRLKLRASSSAPWTCPTPVQCGDHAFSAAPPPSDSPAAHYRNLLEVPYRFDLTELQRRRGLASTGDRARFRSFVRKMASGERVTVAFLGGSITDSGGASKDKQHDFVAIVSRFLNQAAPGRVAIQHAGLAARSSAYFSACLDLHLSEEPDIVLVELAVNGKMPWYTYSHAVHERLLRRLLSFKTRPATVGLHMVRHKSWLPRRARYLQSHGDAMAVAVQYYAQPWLSPRAAFWDEQARGETGFRIRNIVGLDLLHPTDRGHKLLADLVVHAIRHEAAALGNDEPWDAADEALLNAPLPPPLFEDNDEVTDGIALVEDSFRSLAMEERSNGFEWTKSGLWQPQHGFKADRQGSVLALQVDGADIMRPDREFEAALLVLGLMRSSSGMANANVSCSGECSCPSLFLRGTEPGRYRQTFDGLIRAMPPCADGMNGGMIDGGKQVDKR